TSGEAPRRGALRRGCREGNLLCSSAATLIMMSRKVSNGSFPITSVEEEALKEEEQEGQTCGCTCPYMLSYLMALHLDY
ncbi:hypothetical protein A2U01_0005755, partial [Trifolium medium]|nr:hypothetical protein [Trifolium medium]